MPADVKNELALSIHFLYNGQMQSIYTSNVSPAWRFERQEMLLDEHVPEWRQAKQFRDDLDPRIRQGRKAVALSKRAEMLRSTTRNQGGEIVMASLAVFAWTQDDLMQCLTLALARRATVRVLDAELVIPPTPGAEVLHQAAVAFSEGRASSSAHVGGKISGMRKEAIAREKAGKIRDVYGMPSDMMPWEKLLELSSLTRNTIIKHLGSRRDAQTIYAANEKRAAARAKRKEKNA